MNLKIQKIFFLIFLCFNLVYCASLIATPAPKLSWPLKNRTISQKFAPIWNSSHQGLDFKADRGSFVFSSHSGKVIYSGKKLTNYGNTVIIEFSKYWSTLYAHLHEIKVKEGTYVSRGDIIGTVGRSGKATGDHLHFELMYKQQPINPLLYLD